MGQGHVIGIGDGPTRGQLAIGTHFPDEPILTSQPNPFLIGILCCIIEKGNVVNKRKGLIGDDLPIGLYPLAL